MRKALCKKGFKCANFGIQFDRVVKKVVSGCEKRCVKIRFMQIILLTKCHLSDIILTIKCEDREK